MGMLHPRVAWEYFHRLLCCKRLRAVSRALSLPHTGISRPLISTDFLMPVLLWWLGGHYRYPQGKALLSPAGDPRLAPVPTFPSRWCHLESGCSLCSQQGGAGHLAQRPAGFDSILLFLPSLIHSAFTSVPNSMTSGFASFPPVQHSLSMQHSFYFWLLSYIELDKSH